MTDKSKNYTLFKDETDQSSLPKESIYRAYEAVVDRCARLLSFARSESYQTWINIGERQKDLAIDDLIALALHARRLITDTHFSVLARNINVSTIVADYHNGSYRFLKKGGSVTLTRLLNVIIHHDFIEIYRDSRQLYLDALRAHGKRVEIDDVFQHDAQPFSAKLMIKSDKSDALFIDLSEFILGFVERILDPLVDRCADKGIYLRYSLYE